MSGEAHLSELRKTFLESNRGFNKGENQVSARQMKILRDMLATCYPGHKEEDVLDIINLLLFTKSQLNSGTHQHNDDFDDEKHEEQGRHAQFAKWCDERGFVGFTFGGIDCFTVSETGERKKRVAGMASWKRVNADNFHDYILPQHNAFALRTGHLSGLTVIDCDTQEAYKHILRDFPELRDALTIQTRQGSHIYLQYNPLVKTSVGSFEKYPKVDIRNDMGVVFCPPTTYDYFGQKATYSFLNTNVPLLPIPRGMLDLLREDCRQTSVPMEESQEITDLSELTVQHFRSIVRLLYPPTSKRIPVISNGLFSVGLNPISKKYGATFYMVTYELLCIETKMPWEEIDDKLKRFSEELTFDVYVLGNSEAHLLYCVSKYLTPQCSLSQKLQNVFSCDTLYGKDCRKSGWVSILNPKWAGEFKVRVGSAEVIHDLQRLMILRQMLVNYLNPPYNNIDYRKEALALALSKITMPHFDSPLFISCAIPLNQETPLVSDSEETLAHPDFHQFDRDQDNL